MRTHTHAHTLIHPSSSNDFNTRCETFAAAFSQFYRDNTMQKLTQNQFDSLLKSDQLLDRVYSRWEVKEEKSGELSKSQKRVEKAGKGGKKGNGGGGDAGHDMENFSGLTLALSLWKMRLDGYNGNVSTAEYVGKLNGAVEEKFDENDNLIDQIPKRTCDSIHPMFTVFEFSSHSKLAMMKSISVTPTNVSDAASYANILLHLPQYLQTVVEKLEKKINPHTEPFSRRLNINIDKLEPLLDVMKDVAHAQNLEIQVVLEFNPKYDAEKQKYEWASGAWKSVDELIAIYADLIKRYHIFAFMDPLVATDKRGFLKLKSMILTKSEEAEPTKIFAHGPQIIANSAEEEKPLPTDKKPSPAASPIPTLDLNGQELLDATIYNIKPASTISALLEDFENYES